MPYPAFRDGSANPQENAICKNGRRGLMPAGILAFEAATLITAMDKRDLPIACSLTDLQFQERRASVLKKARDAVLEKQELVDGYSYRFSLDRISLMELAQLITVERECCPFLQFDLHLEPGEGPVWMELTGPDGTKDFLDSIFS